MNSVMNSAAGQNAFVTSGFANFENEACRESAGS
jgi:hypothetical protein